MEYGKKFSSNENNVGKVPIYFVYVKCFTVQLYK